MVTPEDIFPIVIAPVIVFLIQYIITKIFESEDKKKKKSIWIKFLRSNGTINKALSRFENIESANPKPIIFILAYVYLFILIIILHANVVLIAIATFIISLVILLLGVALCEHTSKKIKEGNLLNKSNIIKDYYSIITWAFLGVISIIFVIIYQTFVISNKIQETYLIIIRNFYFISILLIISTMVILFITFRRLFFDRLKFEINKLNMKDFPTVNISTSAEIFKGKILNIFDEDLIILDDNGVVKGTQWNDIIVITINHNPANETCQ